MAKNAKKEEFKKPVVDNTNDEPFMEEKTNKNMILLISLSILVVLGLIVGSVYYFSSKENKEKPKDRTEEVEKPIEIKEPEVQEEPKKPVVVEEKPSQVEEPKVEAIDYYYLVFVSETGEQLGERQKVYTEGDITYPEVIEKPGYTHTWGATCSEEENTCTLELVYIKTLVVKGDEKTNYSISLNGNKIIVTGKALYEEGRDSFPGSSYHNFITIKFISPDNLTAEDVANMSVTVSRMGVSGGYTYNTSEAILDSTADDILNGNFWFYLEQAIDPEKTTEIPTITIDWDGEGGLDPITYTIDLSGIERISFTEHNGIEIPSDEEITGGQTPTYTAELTEAKDKIKIDGTVNNYETKTGNMENMGLDSYNNIITLKFTAPENVTDFSNLKVTTTRSGEAPHEYEGPEILDGDNYFYLYQAVDPGVTTTNPTITIDWDGDGPLSEETYIIDLSDARMLQNMEKEGIEEITDIEGRESTYNLTLTEDMNENKYIEVDGNINYYENGISSVGMPAGSIVVTKFNAPEGTNEIDVGNMSIIVNSTNNYRTDAATQDTEGNYYITHYQEVEESMPDATITIDWDGAGEETPQTYTFDISDAQLEEPAI